MSRGLGVGRRRATTSDRLRLRAIAIAESGPAAMVPVLAAVALCVGVAGELLLVLGSAPGARPAVNAVALWSLRGLAAVALAGLIADGFRRRRAGRAGTAAVEPYAPREPARRDLLTAAMLAAAVVLPVLLIPVHYLAARTHPTTLAWNHYGFLDKRWLTSLFLTATIGSALALAVAARAVETGLRRPGSWREWMAGLVSAQAGAGEPESAAGAGWAPTVLKLLCAAAVAAYFFGPPWHLPPTPIGYHEAVTMGGVQAVRTGSLPYIDAAAVQYGPATELANAAYVAATGVVSVDGFREASLLLHWIAATLFLGALVLRVPPLVAAVTALAAITIFPTLQVFSVGPSGFVDGFWGWTDTLRYAGVFVLAMAFPALAARGGAAHARSFALGAAWGILSLVAQENLIGGALVVGVLSVLLVVTGTYGRRSVAGVLGGMVAGLAFVVAPVCVFYAAHGELGRFVALYWLVPRAVAAGYSNTPFHHSVYAPLYDGLPLLLGGLLIAAMLRARPLRCATAWTQERVVLVSALVAALICHLGALTRSDVAHLVNTELSLPAAVCLAAFYLPGLLGARSRRSRWIGGLSIGIVALALLPLAPRLAQPRLVAAKLWRPLHARVSPPPPRPRPAGIPVRSISAARVGDSTLRQPRCCAKQDVAMAQLVRFMDQLHRAVGGRRVLVDSTTVLTPPAVYFLADLRPAPFLQDKGTLALNSHIRARWWGYMHTHVEQTQALVTTSLSRPAPRLWMAAHPAHRTIAFRFAGTRVLVLR